MASKTPEEVQADIIKRFPDIAHIADLYPEIKELILESIASEGTDHEWTDLEFQARMTQTTWWRTRSADARNWDTESTRDPADAERRRSLRTRTIKQRASSYGVTLSDAYVASLVDDSLRWGFTDEELNSLILSQGASGEFAAGTITASADEIQSMARSYLMTLDDKEAQDWALRIEKGEASIDGIRSQLQTQAQQSFPQFASQLEDGNIMDATAGIRSHVANILGLGSADQVDLNSERWADLIDFDPGDGNRRMMTRAEAGRWTRKQTEYGTTDESRNLATSLVSAVGEVFGKRA